MISTTESLSRPAFLDLEYLLAQFKELRIERDDYNINVTTELGSQISTADALRHLSDHDGSGKPAHLYFHIPLCSYVCHFCNYVKRKLPSGQARDQAVDHWTELLIEESERYLRLISWYSDARIESLYFGGGTASVIGIANLERLLQHVRKNYALSPACEITLEGNPDDFQHDQVQLAIGIGVNRFSVGVQSLQNDVTEFTGRGHDRLMSLQAIDRLRNSGKPFNVDVMFGLPHQTADSVRRDVETLCEAGAPTITIYRLRNYDRQKLGIGVKALWNISDVSRRLDRMGVFPSLTDTYQMRNEAVTALLERGYAPSPCGWWSMPGTYGNPNIPQVSRNKWMNYDTMIAFGPGAYGWCSGGKPVLLQTHNGTDISAHARLLRSSDQIPLSTARLLYGPSAVATALGFAFKAFQPINLLRFTSQFGVDLIRDEPYASVLHEMFVNGFLEEPKNGFLRPTLTGEALHEEIISVYFQRRLGAAASLKCNATSGACA